MYSDSRDITGGVFCPISQVYTEGYAFLESPQSLKTKNTARGSALSKDLAAFSVQLCLIRFVEFPELTQG
jgi:hypothetical protein